MKCNTFTSYSSLYTNTTKRSVATIFILRETWRTSTESGTFILSWPSASTCVLSKITATYFSVFYFLPFLFMNLKNLSWRQASADCINLEKVPHADCWLRFSVPRIIPFDISVQNYVLCQFSYSVTILYLTNYGSHFRYARWCYTHTSTHGRFHAAYRRGTSYKLVAINILFDTCAECCCYRNCKL
jgi:hypothetical protein